MKIFVWGTGTYGRRAVNDYIHNEDISAFIDNDKTKTEFMGKKVVSPEYLLSNDYDCVLVATAYSSEIYAQCKELGIDLNKVIFLYNNYVLTDLNTDPSFTEKILGRECVEKLMLNDCSKIKVIPRAHTFSGTDTYMTKFDGDNNFKGDYVRNKTFEMVAHEINLAKIPGAAAEVGVYKGCFAQCINYLFPDRKLYLFDSFEGFEKDEANAELNNGYCDEYFIKSFENTSVGLVMKKMTYPENVIVKQGYFPQSLGGLEETFAFVSLDVDFEESTLEGLRYFYPRLSKGGYIFIHDFNYSDEFNLEGVRRAIERYEAEIGTTLPKVPLCDQGGTLIITK